MGASIILVIIVAFVLGYALVSWFMQLKPTLKNTCNKNGPTHKNGDYAHQEKTSDRAAPTAQQSKEHEFGRVLGLKGVITKHELRRKYLEAIAKYHPDKVNHLALEFQAMAQEKTKALTEAYEYFRVKYDLR